MSRFIPSSLKSLVLSAVLAAVAAPAMAAPTCLPSSVQQAGQVRRMHTSLMVAALRCDEANYGLRSRYSAYVNRYNAQLSDNADTLKGHFSRSGKGASFDRFITSLSNDVSEDGLSDISYCVTHQQMLDALLSGGSQKLTDFAVARGVSVPSGIPGSSAACGGTTQEAKAAAPAKSTKTTTAAKSTDSKKSTVASTDKKDKKAATTGSKPAAKPASKTAPKEAHNEDSKSKG